MDLNRKQFSLVKILNRLILQMEDTMRYIVDRCGHRETFKSLKAAKESMKWLGSGYYTLIDTKTNTETLYFSLANNVVRVR